jgi:hypothetical protein
MKFKIPAIHNFLHKKVSYINEILWKYHLVCFETFRTWKILLTAQGLIIVMSRTVMNRASISCT